MTTMAALPALPGLESGSQALRSCLKLRRQAAHSGKQLLSKKVQWLAQLAHKERKRCDGLEQPLCHQHLLVAGCFFLWWQALRKLMADAGHIPSPSDSYEAYKYRSRAPTAADVQPFLEYALFELGFQITSKAEANGDAMEEPHLLADAASCVAYWEQTTATWHAFLPLRRSALVHALELLDSQPRTGLWLEFGVASGRSLRIMAESAARVGSKGSLGRHTTVFGFDSFEGLPENWRNSIGVGAFSRQGLQPDVQSENRNVELVVGHFEKTIEPFFSERPDEHVSLVHVDCDLDSSATTVLSHLRPRLIPGSLLVFDELINYGGCQSHEFRAVWEQLVSNVGGVQLEWLGCSRREDAVAVVV